MTTQPRKKKRDLSHVTLSPIAESWLLSAEAIESAAPTLRLYDCVIRQFIDYLGGGDLLTVDRRVIREWLVHMKNVGYAESTRRTNFRVIRGFYKWAVLEDEIAVNPTDLVRLPKRKGKVEPAGLTAEQAVALLDIPGKDFMSRRDAAMISVLLDTGLRRAELASLTLPAVQLATGNISVVGKGSKPRTVLMGTKARVTVDRYVRIRAKHHHAGLPHLWLGLKGALTYRGVQIVVSRHGRRVGVPDLHAHMFRHTWASRTRQAGVSEGDLMRLGGWATRDMLDLYGSFDAEYRAQEAYRGNSVLDHL